ncbi:MAG TPA: hypothetical protein VI136_09930, partial [Verrucomicrobiae bacterium]
MKPLGWCGVVPDIESRSHVLNLATLGDIRGTLPAPYSRCKPFTRKQSNEQCIASIRPLEPVSGRIPDGPDWSCGRLRRHATYELSHRRRKIED